MHLLGIHFENARENGTGEMLLRDEKGGIPKWTILPAGPAGREMLHLIAAACVGTRLLPHLPLDIRQLRRDSHSPLQVECLLALHAPFDAKPKSAPQWACGVQIDQEGPTRGLKSRDYHFFPSELAGLRTKTGLGDSWLFLLGYGPVMEDHHDGTDDFDFTDPFFRLTRFRSLFTTGAPLTDPMEFLARMHFRAIKHKRLGAMHIMERLACLAEEYLDVDTRPWMEKECDFRRVWRELVPRQQRALLLALDAARHLFDSFPKCAKPLDAPGLVLFDRPDLFCDSRVFPKWATLMDRLLPEAQFLITVADRSRAGFPPEPLGRSLSPPVLEERPLRSERPAPLPRGTILLLDVDGRLPNLALMKLSRFFKELGRNVVLARHEAYLKGVETVCASCVFFRHPTQARLEKLRNYYGDSLIAGGSGIDIPGRLPDEIEELPADYDLYPELGDRAIGFLTRGCPFHCSFCIVPVKEGRPRQVCTLDELLHDGRRKLILLDDNILAHPNGGALLEEMAARHIEVCFTQTLDLRLVDAEIARIIKRIACSNLRFTRRTYHFSLNDARGLNEVARKYRLFGFSGRDNVEFIFMYGFNTTLADDVERLRFLHSLPGAYVFTQEYQAIRGGPPPSVSNFFDERADELIDELIRIVFTQNMKSTENYYRWVSKRYALAFGRLHQGLVDTIFRYNHRQRKGLYLAEMSRLYGPGPNAP